MAPHNPTQNAPAAADPHGVTLVTRDDIIRCVRRGEAERALYIAEQGRRLWRTLSSLWRRPGSQIPTSYRMNG